MEWYCAGIIIYFVIRFFQSDKVDRKDDAYRLALVFTAVIWPFSMIYDAIPPREY